MTVRRLRAITLKELRHIIRDRRSLGMALGIPVLLLLLFGFALSLDVDRIPTMIHDADRGPAARELIARIEGSRFFDVRHHAEHSADLQRAVDTGEVLLAVAIPCDFSKDLASLKTATVQILLDGSDSNTASIARGYVESLIRSMDFDLKTDARNRRGGQRLAPAVDPRVRVWYNSTLESRNYVVPGLIAVILMIISAMLTSMTIAREWESGTMEQLLSTPVRPGELVLGKMLAFFALGVVDTMIAVLVGVFVFDVPMRGSLVLLAVTSAIFLTGAFFWGIFISAVAKNQVLAFQMGLLSSFLPAFLLSGFIYAIENMPVAIQAITYIFPARYFVTILKGIFLKGVGLDLLLIPCLLLLAYSGIIFTAATRKVRSKLA
jgi:ABC-2 type transport system permease protein